MKFFTKNPGSSVLFFQQFLHSSLISSLDGTQFDALPSNNSKNSRVD